MNNRITVVTNSRNNFVIRCKICISIEQILPDSLSRKEFSISGIIGPDTMTNAEAVQKVTSVLRVPQIVRKASNSPFLHFLPKESDEYIVQVSIKIYFTVHKKRVNRRGLIAELTIRVLRYLPR